ncbi:Thioredoxin [Saccharicrinis carchari]|uniref:Thioredoxin n=1 Tax=Saccharicrinis carchari TaxID=1168039 RepID=A0A521AUR0_SACCC|nr:TlpA disulfide reductase family protein [Saccharicrinis carchari]SMO38592.1 Thioredoxin [Saccharicrinis carchari]
MKYAIDRKLAGFILFFWVVPVLALYSQSATVQTIDFRQLQERIEKTSADSIMVINFWATWCKPCIEEIPVLEKIPGMYKGTAVKVLLVSLDFTDQIEQKLVPFVKSNGIASEVLVLDEAHPNNWIPKVDPSWSGAIPACLFVYKSKTLFHEGKVTLKAIESTMNQLIP